MRRSNWLVLLVLILGWFAVSAVRIIALEVPLEHDEAAYLLRARSWSSGAPATGVLPHWAVGLSALATPLTAVTDDEQVLRAIGLAFGVAFVGGVFALGRAMFNAPTGLIAAAAVAAGPLVQFRATHVLSDIPAAALLVWMTLALWRGLAEQRPALLVAGGVLAAAAFYVRYPAIVGIITVTLALVIVHREQVRANPRAVVGAAGIFLALLFPHVVYATSEFGAPWGVITNASGIDGREYLGQGLVVYFTMLPRAIFGWLGGALALVGLLGVLVRRDPALRVLVIAGVGQMVVMGTFNHAQARYVYFGTALLAIAGASFVGALTRVRAVAVVAVVAAVAALSVGTVRAHEAATTARIGRANLRATGEALARLSEGRACSVLTVQTPQITWYSGCASYHWGLNTAFPNRERLLRTPERFLVLYDHQRYQPEGALRADYLRGATLVATLPSDEQNVGTARIYRLLSLRKPRDSVKVPAPSRRRGRDTPLLDG